MIKSEQESARELWMVWLQAVHPGDCHGTDSQNLGLIGKDAPIMWRIWYSMYIVRDHFKAECIDTKRHLRDRSEEASVKWMEDSMGKSRLKKKPVNFEKRNFISHLVFPKQRDFLISTF